ncbi:unnamed protein product [Clonostachys rosea]|uniref:Amino acid permease/ SLC12A domain-containing protein n=1 Tax=Bionectria ochroleuca TaxID=29856 RepID=A0ABY6UZ49_BIOOC|nr:unnamed protein product [Clonostachys rosea]
MSIALAEQQQGHHHQEKPFTIWTAMGVGHSITNTAITIVAGLASSVALGGAPLLIYGFLAMALVAVCVAITLGELSSAFPHSGGQYYWVSVLAPSSCKRLLSYVTGIVGWAGALCTAASVCLVVPIMVFSMVSLADPTFEYKPWMGFVGYQITNLLTFTFNLFERCLPWVSRSLLCFTIVTITILFVSLLSASPEKQTAENLFVNLYNISGWPDGVAFLIGLNAPNWGFSCLDATVHLANEIPHPARNIPKALLVTVALGAFTGVLTTIALFLSAPDLESVVTAASPSLEILYIAYRQNTGAAIAMQCLITISAAGAIIGVHTWQSRIALAFSRDKGFPFHKYLSQVAPEPFGTPIWAHVWSCAWVSLLGCIYLGSQLAFNSLVSGGILLQYMTYSASALCLLSYGRSKITPGPFWFPKAGYVANIITILWTFFSLVIYCFPSYTPVQADQMNYVSCVIVGVLLYALAYWVLYGRREFQMPQPEVYDHVE